MHIHKPVILKPASGAEFKGPVTDCAIKLPYQKGRF